MSVMCDRLRRKINLGDDQRMIGTFAKSAEIVNLSNFYDIKNFKITKQKKKDLLKWKL